MTHVHFIGICGVAMSALALAFREQGYTVTGSDKGFYPPVSTNLKKAGVPFYPGWHPDKMTKHGDPDLVIVGNVAGSTNPEWLYVQEHNIPYKSYPEAIAEFFIKEQSIVCAGTYGKTTSATILAWIFDQANVPANHMFGGIARNDLPPARLHTDAQWSVVEGDEYKSARWDDGAKFFHYKPTHLLLTACVWDHADLYPTEASYIEAFQTLVSSIPKHGVIAVPFQDTTIEHLLINTGTPVVTFGADSDADYAFSHVVATKDGTSFTITVKASGESYAITTEMLGDYTAKNMTGTFAMAHQAGIAPEHIVAALNNFLGVKRRLEPRHRGEVDVYDDIAHSPAKAQATLETVRKMYDGKIIAVYEPNTGNRKSASFASYANAFAAADEVIIPRLTAVKIAADDTDPPVDGERLSQIIAETHADVHYIEDDDEVVIHLTEQTKKGDGIVFLGSHGFRGMIESVAEKLS